jgi:SAM-dependent methyltransferase
MPSYYHREDCRFCHGREFDLILDLGEMALAGEFRESYSGADPAYPLRAYKCKSCGLVQSLDVVDRDELFHSFLTAYSLKDHFREFADEVLQRFVKKGDFVVEIGSNDGTLLKYFVDAGVKVLGFEPVKKIAKIAQDQGVETLNVYFSSNQAKDVKHKADAIFANNVMAHIDDMDDVMKGVRLLLKDDGVFVFEVHHFYNILKGNQFDNFYHEHLNYYMVGPLAQFLNKHGFEIMEIKPISTHGGSLRIYAKKIPMMNLRNAASDAREELMLMIASIKMQGEHIIGYGASGRGNTLLNYCGLTSKEIDYIVDESPTRYNKFAPGSHISVVPPQKHYDADYILILAWNYKDQIMKKLAGYKGKFIIPLPKLEII